ncbi:MAG: hypothetical protein IJS88_04550 [Alphaproteobacteria bacterium]|jgi:hypothetical protein|nr:hypothetical protein [Alphaproteobacteria bacterium]
MEKELTITETLKQWKSGELDIKALWYDWFCKETSLENKGKTLLQKLNAISGSTKFDNDKTYVFFKNNCPCNGSLFDDFRICDIETGDVIYCVVPKSGYNSNYGKAEVWGKENKFDDPIIEGTWKEVKDWFLK